MNRIFSNVCLKCCYAVVLAVVFTTFSSCGSETKNNSTLATKDEKVSKSDAASANLYAKGEEVFKGSCQACHQANGEGIAGAFPPLAKSDYLLADKKRAITQILKGSSGEITVNGLKYNSAMPPQLFNDEQIADVLNYVLHSWGNNGETVTAEEVKAQRGI
jgi:mono/diheme cytochrome c family protein